MTTNGEWLFSKPFEEQVAWMDDEHHDCTLDGDTDALERKSADLIHEYYKPMVSELQAKVDELQEKLRISWECECKLQAERDELKSRHCPHYHVDKHYCDVHETKIAELQEQVDRLTAERERYRKKFGKCLDYADAIHALMDDEGMA